MRVDVWGYVGLRANAWVGSCTLKTCDIARDKDEAYRAWLPLGRVRPDQGVGVGELYPRWHTSLKLWLPRPILWR